MKKTISILIILLILSCQNVTNKKTDFTLESFNKTISVTNGLIYKNDKLFLGNPRWLKFHPDSFLIVSELTNSSNFIKIIDLKSNEIQEMIPPGQGPGEMIGAWGLGVINNKIWVFDGQTGKICILKMDNKRKFFILHEFKLKEKTSFGAYILNDSLVVCLSGLADKKNRLVYCDFKGNIIRKVGDFPKLKNSAEIASDNNVFQVSLSAPPNGDRVILASFDTDLLEIYSVKKGLEKRIKGPIGIELTAKKKNVGIGYMTSLDPNYSVYYNVACSDSEIWASYCGRQFKKGEIRTRDNFCPKSILCFNNEGKPNQILNFKNNILYFDVDWINKVVYCLEWENESPSIVSYKLLPPNSVGVIFVKHIF